MAATPAGRLLTERHRLAQARLGARTAADVVATWALLDPERVDATVERWLAAAVPIVRSHRLDSARLAAAYAVAFKVSEVGGSASRPEPIDEVVTDRLAVSLTVVGPVAIKRATSAGVPIARASQLAQAGVARAAMRHALDGGRETIVQTVQSDAGALGWARATSARACGFCAMLASRGPVYGADTAGFDAHDGCSCTPEPVYRSDADWPAGARDYRALWNESTDGLSQQDAVNAFRRALGR